MGTQNMSGTTGMLRRSNQLLLAPENHHFEDSTHLILKVKEGSKARFRDLPLSSTSVSHSFAFRTDECYTFKVMVLRRQDELVGPPQHSIIRIIIMFHDPPDEFRAFDQAQMHFVRLYTILYACGVNNANPCTRIDRAHQMCVIAQLS